MAWTAPATYSVAEVVTAAKLNTHVRDNLRYLKGLDGAVTIQDALSVAVNVAAAAGVTIQNSSANSGAYTGLAMNNDSGVSAGAYRCSSTNPAYGGANSLNFLTIGAHPFGIGTNNQLRVLVDANGNTGFGTASPQGRIHALASSGGGCMFLSAAAVAGTLITLAVAGTVTAQTLIYGFSRNNGTGVSISNNGQLIAVGGSVNNVGTDTLQIAVSGAGAITAQRTAGTQTHDVNLLVIYK